MSGGGSKTRVVDPFAGTGVRDLFGGIQNQLTPQLSNIFNVPSGSRFAGPGGLQQQAFGAAQNILPGAFQQAQPQFAQAGQALSRAAAPFSPELAGLSLDAATQQILGRTGDIRRSLLEPFAGADAADSGAAIRALQRGGENISLGLGTDFFNKLFAGEQNQLNRLPGVAQGFQNLAQAPTQFGLNTLQGLLGIGGVQQGFQQQQAGEPFLQQQDFLNTLGQFLPLGLGEPGKTIVNQEQGPGLAGALGPGIGSFLGTEAGAGALAGLGGSLLSGLGGAGGAALGGLGGLIGLI